MAFNQEHALRVVLCAIKPVMDNDGRPDKSVDELVAECQKTFREEPLFAAAFEAACKAVWIEAVTAERESK